MIVIENSVPKESDEPFCDFCLNVRAQQIAELLGKEEEENQKTLPKPPPSELDEIKQRNQELLTINEAQNQKINELEQVIVKHNDLLAQIVERLKSPA